MSVLPRLRTERLELRPVCSADLRLLIELNSDAEVMAHLGGPSTPTSTSVEWAERLGARTDVTRGLGYWLGFEDGVFVGWWSASSFAGRTSTSGLGYRLCRSAWGRGFATEGARAMVGQAFRDPGVERVLASTDAANAGSRRVLEKVGLTLLPGADSGRVGYEITRADWRA